MGETPNIDEGLLSEMMKRGVFVTSLLELDDWGRRNSLGAQPLLKSVWLSARGIAPIPSIGVWPLSAESGTSVMKSS